MSPIQRVQESNSMSPILEEKEEKGEEEREDEENAIRRQEVEMAFRWALLQRTCCTIIKT